MEANQDGSNSTKLGSLTLLSTTAVPPSPVPFSLVLCCWILPLLLETFGRLGKDLIGPSPKYSLTGRAAGKDKSLGAGGWVGL